MPPRPVAVLGPTNTGKTHLAIERLCAHSSGMIGFPLRLLAREVYDRIVAIKGPKEVALVTGEERIVPPGARWFACTVESMPVARDLAFVGIDEAQLGTDPERGHVFTDRLLHARGREETMILGSGSLAPVVRALVPDAEIVRRPRFSTLSFAGAHKISRLPPRSAIVAFSAEQVYAVAEMLRRSRGGAAVVMGALSPRTRNAQVAMFQAGEVDYLVATDAIGMGLNLDVAHVAFASLTKFDGQKQRRLSVAEMAQIAGRAGRHQRDGTFGTCGDDGFTEDEIARLEDHRFAPIDWLYWRDGDPDRDSVAALIAALERRPTDARLRPAPEAIDLAVLKRLADDRIVAERARGPAMVGRLWEACGLPDFRKVGTEHHARLVQRIFTHLSEGDGRLPPSWIASELARLDQLGGDIATLGQRLAGVRTWSYLAERADWIADAPAWAARAQALETKLSDTLHARLVERFVDRRTAMLVRAIGRDPALMAVAVDADGTVRVEDHAIGTLDGFSFRVDPAASAADRKRLVAAAERVLTRERARRAAALIADTDDAFAVAAGVVTWRGIDVATVRARGSILTPQAVADRALDTLDATTRTAVMTRLGSWLAGQVTRHLGALEHLSAATRDKETPAPMRALFAMLVESGGVVARRAVEDLIGQLDPDARRRVRTAGLTIGTLDCYDARLLKPGAMALIAGLRGDGAGPPPGATVLRAMGDHPGFRRFGTVQVRVDLVERVARALHHARDARAPFAPDPALAQSFGIDPATFAAMLRAFGFRPAPDGQWSWRHRPRAARPASLATPASPHFAALAGWGRHGG